MTRWSPLVLSAFSTVMSGKRHLTSCFGGSMRAWETADSWSDATSTSVKWLFLHRLAPNPRPTVTASEKQNKTHLCSSRSPSSRLPPSASSRCGLQAVVACHQSSNCQPVFSPARPRNTETPSCITKSEGGGKEREEEEEEEEEGRSETEEKVEAQREQGSFSDTI